MTIPLIQNIDGFEAVRNAVSNLLIVESAKQVALAESYNLANPTLEQLNPEDWSLDVFVEGGDPFEMFRDDESESAQLVSVWYDSSTVNESYTTQLRQWTDSNIMIDCVACAVACETDTGQESGYKNAFMRAQRIARIVRRILIHPDNVRFGIPSIVKSRSMNVRRSLQPNSQNVPDKHIACVQIQMDITHLESFDMSELPLGMIDIIKVYRTKGGPLVHQMNYDWTE